MEIFAKNAWRFISPILKKNFQLITYDLRGHGKSPVPKDEFKFTLITGKGQFKNGKIEPGNADELQEMFTTSIIVNALNDAKTTYKVTGEDPKGNTKRQAFMSIKNPSKLFFKIYMGTLDLADIEIRYKGSITGEPQFFAFITPNFKYLSKVLHTLSKNMSYKIGGTFGLKQTIISLYSIFLIIANALSGIPI